MKTRIITIIVALVAIVTGAQAQHAYLHLKIAGVEVTQDNMHNLSSVIQQAGGSGYAYYSELSHELTLKNVELTCNACCIDSYSNGIYIIFEGENHLTCYGYSPAIRLNHSTEAVIKGGGSVSLNSNLNSVLEINSSDPVSIENVNLDILGLLGINGKNKGNLTIHNSTVQVRSGGGQAVSNLASLSIKGSSDVTFYVRNYETAGINYAMGGVQNFSLDEDMTFAQPSGGHFEVDEACNIYTSSGQAWSDDIHFATTAICINNTNFPDANFKSYVRTRDGDDDGYLNKAERRRITTIDVQGKNIGDLTGIGYFTNLETLNCSNNKLTSLDVPLSVKTLNCQQNKLNSLNVMTNTVLTTLDCSSNQLTSLTIYPVYGYNSLTTLNCSNNNLASLYLTNQIHLTDLNCSHNSLTSLDVTTCQAMSSLNCSYNSIPSLVVSTCPILEKLDCSNNSNLTTIAMPESLPKLTRVIVNNTSLGFTMHETIVNNLPTAYGTFTPATKISIDDVTRAKSKKWTVNTTGIEAYKISNTTYFPDANFRSYLANQSYGKDDGWVEASEIRYITKIEVPGKNIQSLKGIEHFTYLNTLVAYDNLLTTIDLSKNTALQYLHIYNNDLSALNLSNNHELLYLDCSENNGNSSLNVTGCSKLYYLNAQINNLSSLDVTSCTALKNIYCTFNHLKSLNLSNNNKLENVSCSVNQLTSFLLPNTTTLKTIKCANNKLKDGGMWSTVYSLPYVESGDFYVTNDSDVNEGGNALTQEQLAIVMERGWTAYHQLDANNWKPYTLGAPTGVERIASDAADGAQRYNLQGQHVGTYYKGIVVKNGRKVLKK